MAEVYCRRGSSWKYQGRGGKVGGVGARFVNVAVIGYCKELLEGRSASSNTGSRGG